MQGEESTTDAFCQGRVIKYKIAVIIETFLSTYIVIICLHLVVNFMEYTLFYKKVSDASSTRLS